MSLFDTIQWRDPVSGCALEPIVESRTPAGVPLSGALRVSGTSVGYPIVDSVARLTPQLAKRFEKWLQPYGLTPPDDKRITDTFQDDFTVESFGWQWALAGDMRSEADLRMRVCDNFGIDPTIFKNKLVLDAGCGAGDQSRYLLAQGASVISIDLSDAVDVTARKLRMEPGWVGVQGDITMLPIQDSQIDLVYCEGVLQHTRDSSRAVQELTRVAGPGGLILARHYTMRDPKGTWHNLKRILTSSYYNFLRRRFQKMDRYKRLIWTGNLAALAYVPLIGALLQRSATVLYYPLQGDFKTTWINTYDYYGGHEYQRFITPEEFWNLFDGSELSLLMKDEGGVVAKKVSSVGS